MKVEQAMTKDVSTCLPDERIRDAAERLEIDGRGSLVVIEPGDLRRVAGIVTDRDVALAAARAPAEFAELEVRSIMSVPAHCCRPDDALWELLAMAETHRVRRYPVIDGGGQLLGMISLDDVAREAARPQSGIPALSAHEVCRVIALCSERSERAKHLQLGG